METSAETIEISNEFYGNNERYDEPSKISQVETKRKDMTTNGKENQERKFYDHWARASRGTN